MLPLNWSLQPSPQEHVPCIPFPPSASSSRKDPICFPLSCLCAVFLVQMQRVGWLVSTARLCKDFLGFHVALNANKRFVVSFLSLVSKHFHRGCTQRRKLLIMSCAPLSLLVPVSPSWVEAVDTAPVVYPAWGWIHTALVRWWRWKHRNRKEYFLSVMKIKHCHRSVLFLCQALLAYCHFK